MTYHRNIELVAHKADRISIVENVEKDKLNVMSDDEGLEIAFFKDDEWYEEIVKEFSGYVVSPFSDEPTSGTKSLVYAYVPRYLVAAFLVKHADDNSFIEAEMKARTGLLIEQVSDKTAFITNSIMNEAYGREAL